MCTFLSHTHTLQGMSSSSSEQINILFVEHLKRREITVKHFQRICSFYRITFDYLPNGRSGCFVHKYRRLMGDKYDSRKHDGYSDVALNGLSPTSPKSYQNGSRVIAESGNEGLGFKMLSKLFQRGNPPR